MLGVRQEGETLYIWIEGEEEMAFLSLLWTEKTAVEVVLGTGTYEDFAEGS